jgi:hypothetical protein
MKIPENRIYKVRSTARQAPKIADPNLGAYPAAIARGMAPAIQGAIAATGQQIRNTLQAAKNPHWLTHLKLAQTIAQTGAQTSRDLATAYERRLAHGLEEDQVDYANHMRQFYDSQDADGNLVEGKIRSKWNPDSKEPSGPVKALTDLDAGYDETDHYRGLSAERRARFDQWRSGQREKYANDAIREQQRQMEQHRRDVETKRVNQLAFDVENAMRPDSQNWEAASTAYATEAANKMVPESVRMKEDGTPVDLWTATFQQTKSNLRMKRNALWNSAYELLGENGDDAEKAAKLRAAIDADTEAGGDFLTEEQLDAMKAAGEASRMKRIANIEAGYQQAERDVETAATAFSLVRPGEAGKADRDALDANAAAALERLPQGPRREAAVRAYNEAKDTLVAQSFLNSGLFQTYLAGPPQSRREDTQARRNAYNEAKAAYDGLTDSQRMAMNRILDAQRDAQMKRETDMAKKVSGWASGGMSAMDMARNLNQKFAAGVISAAEHDAGMREARKAAAYENVFKDNPDARKAHDAMVMRSVRKLFAGFGDGAVERLFKWDKNGFLVYNDDGTPALADGVARTARFTAMHNGTFYTTRERGVESNWPNYVDVSAATVAEAASVAREYITQFYMGGVAGSKNGTVSQSDLDEYMVSMLGDKASRASDEAMSATAMSIIGTVPALVTGGVDFMSASRMASDRSGDAAEKRQKKEGRE